MTRGMLTIGLEPLKVDQTDGRKDINEEKERERGGHAVSVLRGS